MKDFRYVRLAEASDVPNVVKRSANPQFVAGGTNQIDLMKLGIAIPDTLLDISRLALKNIEVRPDGSLLIGALATNAEVAYHTEVHERFPALSRAIMSGATPQLRNAATVGGNILQRTRCWYFREGMVQCNKKMPSAGCPAIVGFSGEHAIHGASDKCIAVHPSDMCVALTALDAVVHTQSANGKRRIPFTDFHLLPGDTPERETVLEPGELIVAVELPATRFAARSTYVKTPIDGFAHASCAAAIHMRDGLVEEVRLAFGGVAHKPWRSHRAEAVLTGKPLDDQTLDAAAAAAIKGTETTKDNAYKVPLMKVVLKRALNALKDSGEKQ